MGVPSALPVVLFRVGSQLCALPRDQVRAMGPVRTDDCAVEQWLGLPPPQDHMGRVSLELGNGTRITVIKSVELAEFSPHHIYPVPTLLQEWAVSRHVRAMTIQQGELVLIITSVHP